MGEYRSYFEKLSQHCFLLVVDKIFTLSDKTVVTWLEINGDESIGKI